MLVSAQTPDSWTPELQIKVRGVATPRVSPDGRRVVYTVSDAVTTAERSEYVSQIWMASADGKENTRLTYADKSSTNPKWSPDGNWIAFTSNRKDNKNNLYLLRVSGGEAEALTDVKSGVGDFDWSPDGRWIAFSMADAKTEEEEKNDKAKNDFRWVDENVKMSRLYVIPVQKDALGKREPRKLTAENYTVNEFDWSPDGSRIIFSHQTKRVGSPSRSASWSWKATLTITTTPTTSLIGRCSLAEGSPSRSANARRAASPA